MADQDSNAPFQRIQELERENEALREQLREKQTELEEADAEIERLRQELKSAQRASRQSDSNSNSKRKKKEKPKRPGRKPGQGTFTRRAAPDTHPSTPLVRSNMGWNRSAARVRSSRARSKNSSSPDLPFANFSRMAAS